MAFSAGIYSRLFSWTTDRNNNVRINAARMDAEMDGFATGLSQAILKDGTQTITADIPWNGHKSTGLGLATAGADAMSRDASDARFVTYGTGYTLTAPQQLQARTNLGLGNGSARDVGTTAGTLAAGDDSRFTSIGGTAAGALQKAANLSDLADTAAAKTNLGINNVSNTSDANKPVSTAQQTALDAKLPKDGSQAMTGALTLVSGSVAKSAGTLATFGLQTSSKTRSLYYDNTTVGITNEAGTGVLSVDNSGNLTAVGNVTAFSDERLKADIQTISCALELVRQLRGVAYTRKETGAEEIGVIAQEVADVFPEVVLEHEDGFLSVNYGALVAPLIEAVKVLAERIEALEAGR